VSDHDQFADFIHQDAVKVWQDVGVRMGEMLAEMMDKRISGAAFRERGREKTNGGCPSELDSEADRKSVTSQRCRDTGGQPFESAPATPESDRLAEWERHGSRRWGLGVASDLYDLECRVAAIEKTNHGAAPAARASDRECTAHAGTGGTMAECGVTATRRAHNPETPGSIPGTPTHDAAPAANPQRDTAPRQSERGTGNQTAPPCVETDGSSSAIAQPPASSDGSGEGRPLDDTRPNTTGEATGGRGRNTSVTNGDTSAKPVAESQDQRQEPVAWAVRKQNPPIGESPVLCWYESEMRSVEKSLPGCTVIPLYRAPQTCPHVVGRTTQYCSLTPFTLTDEERAAIQWFAYYGLPDRYAATLCSLLERTK
jgi:hypothetical protein